MTGIQGVYFEPYVGPDYEKMQKRILILGESHYQRETNCTIKGSDKTINVAKNYITGKKNYRFLNGVLSVLNGAGYKKDDLKNYAFYNYVQSFVAGGPRHRPEGQQWKDAEEPFINVLKILKPDLVLCCGKALYNHLPDDPDKEQRKDGIGLSDGEPLLWCREYHYHIEAKGIRLLGIHHPSSVGFSGRRYHELLASYLIKGKENKERAE